MNIRLAVVGNPDNRRVSLFAAAVRAAGLQDPLVVPWRSVAADASPEFPPDAWVRIESPGEDAEVDRLLRGADEAAGHGEIVGGADWYAGFGQALERITQALSTRASLLNDPHEIMVMFDKRRCHARLSAAGIPVPPALTGSEIDGYDALRKEMTAAGWSRVFVKPAHGSSASGILAFRVAAGRVAATTPVELADGKLFNSLRVREYHSERDIATIVDRLAPDGLHVERWYPKLGLHNRTVDVRVVVIAGEATHAVVRSSRYPMTNLHLGNARGDLAALRELVGPDSWRAGLATCERIATVFPRTLHLGVDLMFSANGREHAVAEVNAFGDLLPNLFDAHGRDTYAAEVAALTSGRWAP